MFEMPNTFPLCFVFPKGKVFLDNDRLFRKEAKVLTVLLSYDYPLLKLATFAGFFTMPVTSYLLKISLLLNPV